MEGTAAAEGSVRTKMESLQLICDREISIQQHKMDDFMAFFRKSLESVKTRAHETVQNQGELRKLKVNLREAEDDLVKALAAKTRQEAKRMVTMDLIAATKSRIEELKRSVQEWGAKRDQYAAIICQQSKDLAASEEMDNSDIKCKEETQEAISWYNRVLGFRIEGGHGVKFTFTNINPKNLSEEYYFTIRHANDTYTLLDCNPHLNDTKELIHDLNKTNGLFRFVRIMREKFQETAIRELLPQLTTVHQDSSIISLSAPVSSVSTEISDSPAKKQDHQVQHEEVNRHFKKINHGRGIKSPVISPGSSSSVRRSSRFKAKK